MEIIKRIPREPWYSIQKSFNERMSKITPEEQEKLQKDLIKILWKKK